MTSQFLQTTFADGLRMPNYVNGRLLSAEDLRADQAATLARLARLGKATGHGVVEGLMVTQAGTASVQVTAGLGVVPAGHLLRLPVTVTLPLKPEGGAASVSDLGLFRDCAFAAGNGGGSSLADGAYVLTAVPTTQTEGQAPLKSTAGSALPAGCAAAWEVEGVQFKAIRLTAFGVGGAGATDKNRQNRLAHWCFGSENLRRLPPDPFRFGDDYGGLASVAAADLTDCDLPLAVFYWQGTGIAFVEPWAVRRRLIHPLPAADWRGLLADRRVADAEARCLQFQDQVSRLLAAGSVATLKAVDHFRYLPPVGFLPIRPPQFLVDHLVNQLLEQVKKAKLGGSQRVEPERKARASATLASSATVAEGGPGHAALFTTQPLLSILLEAQQAAGVVLQPAAEAVIVQPKVSIEELLREQTLARMPKAGFDLPTFFGATMPGDVHLIDGDSVDFYLQRSWFDEVIDLKAGPRFDVYLVQDVWLRLVGAALLQAIDAVLAGRTASVRQAAKAQLAALLPPAIPGVADVPYAMFVKQPRPKVTVPVQKPPAPPAGITGNVAVWHGYPAGSPEAKILQSLAAQAEQDNPAAKISLQAVPGNELPKVLLAAVAAGSGPDLVLWRDEHLSTWLEQGIVRPLDEFLALEPAVLPAVRTAMTRQGKVCGVPLTLDTVAMHLNRRLLDEFGMAAPQSTDELVGFVEHFTGSNFPVILPLPLFFPYGLLVAEGGLLVSADGRCAFDAFRAGFELLQRLRSNGAIFTEYEQAAEAFRNGRSPITVDGPWALAGYPERLGAALSILPLPDGLQGPARPLAFVHAFYLTTSSQNKANAAQVAHLLAGVEAQKLLARDAHRIPTRQDVAVNDEHMAAFVVASAHIHPLPAFPGFSAWERPLSEIMAQVVDGRPPDDAAKAACDVISG